MGKKGYFGFQRNRNERGKLAKVKSIDFNFFPRDILRKGEEHL